MPDDETTNRRRLVASDNKELAIRSSALVHRGLQDLAQLDSIAVRVEKLVVPFLNLDYDARAEAAKAIVEFAPSLTIREPNVSQLVLEIVSDLYFLFERGQALRPPAGEGSEYYPPDERYERLLWHALESLVGPISDMHDAVLKVFLGGDVDAKVKAAEWLGTYHIYRATKVLQDALVHASDERLSLAIRYALSHLGAEDADAFCQELSQQVLGTSGDSPRIPYLPYLRYLAHDLSAETLGRLLSAFGTDEREDNREFALWLLEFSSGESSDGTWGSFRPDPRHDKALRLCPDPMLDDMVQRVWRRFLASVLRSPLPWHVDTTSARDLRLSVLMIQRKLRQSAGIELSDLDGGASQLLFTLLEEKDRRSPTEPAPRDDFKSAGYNSGADSAPVPADEDVEAQHELAFGFLQRGQTDQAIKEYREILRLAPGDHAAHYNLGNAFRQKGLLDEAIREFKEALGGEFDGMAGAHYTLANTLSQRGLLDDAIAEYRKALRLPQQLPDTHLKCHINLGLALEQTGRFDAAIHEFRQALKLAPQSADAHCYLGEALRKTRDLDEAILELREAVRLQPNHEFAVLALASALAAKGLTDESVKVLKTFLA